MASTDQHQSEEDGGTEKARARIVVAALQLIDEGGVAALTTRAVAQAAGVQAPTIYRLFGDKTRIAERGGRAGNEPFCRGKRWRSSRIPTPCRTYVMPGTTI